MSHFNLLVFTPRKPTEGELSTILMPWHEFECTGYDNEYVVEIDETEKRRAEYAKEKRTMLRAPDGSLHCPYEPEFYRNPTPEEIAKVGSMGGFGFGHGLTWDSRDWGDGQGYRAKVKFVPDGYKEVEVPAREVKSFAEWLGDGWGRKTILEGEEPDFSTGEAHKYGYTVLDRNGEAIKTVDRTNPNAKWDGWQIGGRWSGMLGAYDPEKDPANYQTCWLCEGTGKRNDELGREFRLKDPSYTCNGCNGEGTSLKWPSQWRNADNQLRIKDIDWAALKAKQVRERRDCWNKLKAAYEKRPIPDMSFEEARKAWAILTGHSRAARGSGDPRPLYQIIDADPMAANLRRVNGEWQGVPDHVIDVESWAQETEPLTAFAAVKDGKWYERGEMGWFACVSNEKDEVAWKGQIKELFDSAGPNSWVTVIDCHI